MRNRIMLSCVFAAMLAVPSSFANMLQIKGSDTLINLVQRLSEVYMQQNPSKPIAVTGGGSGTGIAALMNKKCDIANSSRNMKPKEIAKAQDRGVMPKRIVIAMDGLSVIVNPNNPVGQLTKDQVGGIFRGDITNWSEVGGDDSPITLYGRQSNSGTFIFFRDAVLKGEYSASMNRMNGNSQIIEGVKADQSAIGYVGVGYVQNTTSLKVVAISSAPGKPYASPLNEEDVKSGAYPIVRPLNQYIDGSPSEQVREFINFELSPEGQGIVVEEGFFPVPPEYQQFNSQSGF